VRSNYLSADDFTYYNNDDNIAEATDQ